VSEPPRRSPTTVYRLYGHDGALLYIGVAGNPGRRFEQHAGEKPWWGEVKRADLTHYPTREQALLVERNSIAAEHPRHNILGRRPPSTGIWIPPGVHGHGTWVFAHKESGYTRALDLHLSWECEVSSISDDWLPDEITAYELWDEWTRYLERNNAWDRKLGQGWVTIWWSIRSTPHDIYETAPFQVQRVYDMDFLTHFTWPVHRVTGEELNWLTLPVRDLAWNQNQRDKGGFVQ
jgi:hypothetical protein